MLVVVGPTGSGKSALALRLAQTYRGELVCADSRQVYTGLTIGSAKDVGAWEPVDGTPRFISDGIVEHLVDVIDPRDEWNVGLYQQQADAVIQDIHARGKLPIVVGGTGLYIQALVDRLQFPEIAPNPTLRAQLAAKTLEELQASYEACDPVGALVIDRENRRRLIRAIEVTYGACQPFSQLQTRGPEVYRTCLFGCELPRAALYARLDRRVLGMVEAGLVAEVRGLLEAGVDAESSALSGIGYREVVSMLRGEITEPQMIALIQQNTRRLAKRQVSWFRRDPRITWVTSWEEAQARVQTFLTATS